MAANKPPNNKLRQAQLNESTLKVTGGGSFLSNQNRTTKVGKASQITGRHFCPRPGYKGTKRETSEQLR
jgi:hypothetical protein